jgi:aspartyl-tRNA(Asn)/glutamyl-tRNA(Gln) amidotransferase subunit A
MMGDLVDYYVTNFTVSAPGSVALEDSIMKKNALATAGSKMLGDFVSPINATVVERLENAGKNISGKTQMKEFGISSMEDRNDDFSGSFKAVTIGNASSCLCNDLFGTYRQEAAENGLVYIQPTYGTVSRYGLIPLATSMDQIGVLCKDLKEGFSLLSIIAGNDPKDGAMFLDTRYAYESTKKDIRLCTPSEIITRTDAKTQDAIRDFVSKFTTVDYPLDYFDVYKQTMYVLSCAEISHNINRYDGIKFGYRSPNAHNLESLYTNTRTEAFGLETKLTSIMGAMILSSEHYSLYYEKAMKIRSLIKNAMQFEKYDVIVLPASIGNNPYENLSLYALTALAGLPSISFSYKGCGIQLVSGTKNEEALIAAWEMSQK